MQGQRGRIETWFRGEQRTWAVGVLTWWENRCCIKFARKELAEWWRQTGCRHLWRLFRAEHGLLSICLCSSLLEFSSFTSLADKFLQSLSPARGCRGHSRLLARRPTARKPLQSLLQGRSQVWTLYQGGLASVLGLCSPQGLHLRHCCRPPPRYKAQHCKHRCRRISLRPRQKESCSCRRRRSPFPSFTQSQATVHTRKSFPFLCTPHFVSPPSCIQSTHYHSSFSSNHTSGSCQFCRENILPLSLSCGWPQH